MAPDEPANLAERYRNELEANNYVQKAKPDGEYWHGWDEKRVMEYLAATGGNFHLIVIGSSQEPTDFYCIPYWVLAAALTEETVAKPRRRWTAQIRHHQLKVRNWPAFDIGQWYGDPSLLRRATPYLRRGEFQVMKTNMRLKTVGLKLRFGCVSPYSERRCLETSAVAAV